MRWESVRSDVGGLSMGRGSKCSDPCEMCWGTVGRKTWFGWMQVRLLLVPGFRSKPDLKSSPTKTVTYNRSLKKPPFVIETGCYNSRVSFPVEFYSSLIKNYSTDLILSRVTHGHLPHLPHCR